MSRFFSRYRSLILYGFFGVCTTLVNIAVYWLCAHPLHLNVSISTAAAWFLSVLFAYVTNRKWVFDSEQSDPRGVFGEMLSFFASRVSTGLLDWLIMFIAVEKLGFNDMIIKVVSNVLVIVLNYILSRFIVFRKR